MNYLSCLVPCRRKNCIPKRCRCWCCSDTSSDSSDQDTVQKKKKRLELTSNTNKNKDQNTKSEFYPLTDKEIYDNASKESCRCNESWVQAYILTILFYVLPVLVLLPVILQNAMTSSTSSYTTITFVSLVLAHVYLLVIGNMSVRAFARHSIERYFRRKCHLIAEELRLGLLSNSDNAHRLARMHSEAVTFLQNQEKERQRVLRKQLSFKFKSVILSVLILICLVINIFVIPVVISDGNDIEISPSKLGIMSIIFTVILPMTIFAYVNVRHPPNFSEKLPLESLTRDNTRFYKRIVRFFRPRFIAVTILVFGALLVILPFITGLPISLTLLTSADETDWTLSFSRSVLRILLSLLLTALCVFSSVYVFSKNRRLPRECRKKVSVGTHLSLSFSLSLHIPRYLTHTHTHTHTQTPMTISP